MSQDDFTPTEQAIISRLRQAPQWRLTPRAYHAIHEKILAELANPTPPPTPPAGGNGLFSAAPGPWLMGGLVMAVALVIGGIVAWGQVSQGGGIGALATPTEVATPTEMPVTPSLITTSTATWTATATRTPSPTFTATATTPAMPTVTPTEVVLLIEGTVDQVVDNVITIQGTEVLVPTQHPLLAVIDVEDTLRIEAVSNIDGVLEARVIANLTAETTDATVGLVGPIEAINGNRITVNGVELVLGSDEPLLPALRVGDFVDVEGNVEQQGAAYVIVVLRVAVLTTAAEGIAPHCYFEERGMGMGAMGMGRWRCDAMGAMGMGGMGMGMGMGN